MRAASRAPGTGFRLGRFIIAFVIAAIAWRFATGSALERFVIHELTVAPAAAWIALVAPATLARAEGDRIEASGGSVRVLSGCEGADVAFLLVAALFAIPLGARKRLALLVRGLAIVFLLNQLRLGWLFFAARHDAGWFAISHELLAPLALAAAVAAWLHGAARPARLAP